MISLARAGLLLGLLQPWITAAEPISCFDAEEREQPACLLADAAGAPTLALQVHLIHWPQPVARDQVHSACAGWDARHVRAWPETVVGVLADGMDKGDLPALRQLYEPGSGVAEADFRFADGIADIAKYRVGSAWTLVEEARFGSYAAVMWCTKFSNGMNVPWVEYLHLGEDGWRLTAKLGDMHLARLLMDAQSEAQGNGAAVSAILPLPHEDPISFADVDGAPRIGVADRYCMKLSSRITTITHPATIDTYQGADPALAALHDLRLLYAQHVPLPQLNACWRLGENEAYSDQAPIDPLGWCGNPKDQHAAAPLPTMAFAELETPQGTAVLLGHGNSRGRMLIFVAPAPGAAPGPAKAAAAPGPAKTAATALTARFALVLIGQKFYAFNRLLSEPTALQAIFQ